MPWRREEMLKPTPNAGKEEQTRVQIIIEDISGGVNGSHDGGCFPTDAYVYRRKNKRGVGGMKLKTV